MGAVGQTIRAQRVSIGMTLDALARAAGCTRGYLSAIENDKRDMPPSRELLERLEVSLRMERGALVSLGSWQAMPPDVKRRVMKLEEQNAAAARLARLLRERGVDALHKSGELQSLVDQLGDDGAAIDSKKKGDLRGSIDVIAALPKRVPLINRVSAGYPTEFTDLGYPARVADEYVSVPDLYDDDAFAARVIGDSMEPRYREGDIVVFSPAAATRPGSDCFVRFERGEETTFKRVYFEEGPGGGERIRLQPLNSAYPPRVVDREEVAGLYAAVFVVRPIGDGE